MLEDFELSIKLLFSKIVLIKLPLNFDLYVCMCQGQGHRSRSDLDLRPTAVCFLVT